MTPDERCARFQDAFARVRIVWCSAMIGPWLRFVNDRYETFCPTGVHTESRLSRIPLDEAMSKAAGGGESASKGPRRRQPRRGPGKLDVFEPDDCAPGGFKNTFPGDPRESKRARSTGKKSLAEDVEQAAPQVLASVEAVLREYKV